MTGREILLYGGTPALVVTLLTALLLVGPPASDAGVETSASSAEILTCRNFTRHFDPESSHLYHRCLQALHSGDTLCAVGDEGTRSPAFRLQERVGPYPAYRVVDDDGVMRIRPHAELTDVRCGTGLS